MSNEIVDLKLDTKGEDATKPAMPDNQQTENTEGAFRYDALKNSDVNSLKSDTRPTLITLFGISECGKTTFVGSLFAILRRRPELLNVSFVDSDTLTGFERRVHQRFLSETGQSVIQRTVRKAGSILNVVLANEHDGEQNMFVISDLSGEIYNDCISDKSIVLQQDAVRYADKLVIFADVEALLKAKTYNSYKENFKSLLARFKENGMLPNNAVVYVALNKTDMVEPMANETAMTVDGQVDENKKSAFLQVVDERKQAIVSLVKEHMTVSDDNIYNICSLGIQVGEEDKELINLFNKMLSKKESESLPTTFNWIQNISKN